MINQVWVDQSDEFDRRYFPDCVVVLRSGNKQQHSSVHLTMQQVIELRDRLQEITAQ